MKNFSVIVMSSIISFSSLSVFSAESRSAAKDKLDDLYLEIYNTLGNARDFDGRDFFIDATNDWEKSIASKCKLEEKYTEVTADACTEQEYPARIKYTESLFATIKSKIK